MRYTPEHKAGTRRRIVKNAARQLRREGLAGPGVADLMSACGLTVGGFYKHFHAKEELVLAAIEEALRDSRERFLAKARAAPAGKGWKAIITDFLSLEHCEHPEESGCPMAAMATEMGRAAAKLKKQIGLLIQGHREQLLPFMPGATTAEKEKNLTVAAAAMNGALAIARMTDDRERQQRVLETVREYLLRTLGG